MTRIDHEGPSLAPFEREAAKLGLQCHSGQGIGNSIPLTRQVRVQFGDLRVDAGDHWVIVEVESSGGVTNLAKYWYLIDNQWEQVEKPIRLFHVFRVGSPNDYLSHLLTWDHLAEYMAGSVGDRFVASRHTYSSNEELASIVSLFTAELSEKGIA